MQCSVVNAMDQASLAKKDVCILMAPLVVRMENSELYKMELMHQFDQHDNTLTNLDAYIAVENFEYKSSLFSLTYRPPLLRVGFVGTQNTGKILELNEEKECVHNRKPFQHITSSFSRLSLLAPDQKFCMILEQVDNHGNVLPNDEGKKFCLSIAPESYNAITALDRKIENLEKTHTARQYTFLKIGTCTVIAVVFVLAYFLKFRSK
jgi:hypothetical protein